MRLTSLSEANLDFAFEVLGTYAFDYLRRRYRGKDPRLEEHLLQAEISDSFSAIS